MTERQRNKQEIGRRLNKLGIGYTPKLLDFICDIHNESYNMGFKQKQFDLLQKISELQDELNKLKDNNHE